MSLSHAHGVPPTPEAARALLLRAVDLGVTYFDTARLYGFGANEDLVGPILRPFRSRILLATKGGVGGVTAGGRTTRVVDARPETLRQHCEDSLRRLQTDVIDLYYLHRWDKRVPLEDSIGALAELVREGKIRALGLSEVSAATLRRAHAVHPIVVVQTEYSLWTRNAEIAVLDACRAVGAAFVAFGPLARGFLSGRLRDPSALHPTDIRRTFPRFQDEYFPANLRLLDAYVNIARDAGCTMAQLALAWLLARGDHVIPIPGTTRIEHLEENLGAAEVRVTPELLARLDATINQQTVAGPRYNAATQAEIDTEEF